MIGYTLTVKTFRNLFHNGGPSKKFEHTDNICIEFEKLNEMFKFIETLENNTDPTLSRFEYDIIPYEV